MKKIEKTGGWSCPACGYIFTPGMGNPGVMEVDPAMYFDRLPDDWECPECGTPKQRFKKLKHKKDEKND
jgi:rubredoxin